MNVIIAATLIASGVATRYDPGVMPPALANQIRIGHVPAGTSPAECVALLDCGYLGQQVWLEYGRIVHGPYVVCDCAQEKHQAQLIESNWAVDLSWTLAQDLGLPIPHVLVWSSHPRRPGDRRLPK